MKISTSLRPFHFFNSLFISIDFFFPLPPLKIPGSTPPQSYGPSSPVSPTYGPSSPNQCRDLSHGPCRDLRRIEPYRIDHRTTFGAGRAMTLPEFNSRDIWPSMTNLKSPFLCLYFDSYLRFNKRTP